jgi:hypothetical protein
MIWICFSAPEGYDVVMLPPVERYLIGTSLLMQFWSAMMSPETKRKNRSSGAFSQIYNARPQLVQSNFDLMGIHRLRHPVYGPDIAGCGFGFSHTSR